MSRSRRKTPITGWTCAESDRPYKKLYHGQERTAQRNALSETKKLGDDNGALSVEQVIYEPWLAPKDGKVWWGKDAQRWWGRPDEWLKRVFRK